MARKIKPVQFSRRQREIMDALHALGEGSVEDVRQRIPDDVGYDSVRTTLRILEQDGHVKRRRDGRKDLFSPALPRAAALKSAWMSIVETFFRGSHEDAAATLLQASDRDLSEKKLASLLAEIDKAKRGL